MKTNWTIACLGAAVTTAGLLPFAAIGREEDARVTEPESFTLNALDYRLNIFDLRQGRHGISRHTDQNFRLYVGDLYFNGEDFIVLENERYTGHFVDLGEEKKPDDEFALFHSLRIYKHNFQVRHFPFLDKYQLYPAIDANQFFVAVREPRTAVKVGVSRLYLLRLFHRTTVRDERVFLLRVIDHTPGVKATVLWRELEVANEP